MIGIVVLNYKNYFDTLNCLSSIKKNCDLEAIKVVVVDNGSKNESVKRIKDYLDQGKDQYLILDEYTELDSANESFVIFELPENLGYAKGNNIGIRYLIDQKADYVLVLNNDTILTSDITKPLSSELSSNEDLGMIGPLLLTETGEIDHSCCRSRPTIYSFFLKVLNFFPFNMFFTGAGNENLLRDKSQLDSKIVYCDILSGACVMARRNVWEKLNGFDENTYLYYEEDILCEKLNKLNLLSALITDESVIHVGASSTSGVSSSWLLKVDLNSMVYYLRNYRNVNLLTILFIKWIRYFHISVLYLKDSMRLKRSN